MTYKNCFSHAISHLVLGVTQLQLSTALKASERFTISCACAQRVPSVDRPIVKGTLCSGCPAHRNVQIFPESGIITMDSCSFIDVAIQIGGHKSIHYFVQLYVTSRANSRCLIEDQPSSRRTGEIWLNFLVLVKTRAAKFCTSCSL